MTTGEAIETLMAHACCCFGELHCMDDCPKNDGNGVCASWEPDEVIEAVKVLTKAGYGRGERKE